MSDLRHFHANCVKIFRRSPQPVVEAVSRRRQLLRSFI
jgi:hypothetical protein